MFLIDTVGRKGAVHNVVELKNGSMPEGMTLVGIGMVQIAGVSIRDFSF